MIAEAQTGTDRMVKVSVKNVSKHFATGDSKASKRFFALKDVSLDVQDGEFVTLVGPSGCGKSTLLNLIAGFEKPDAGELFFEGKPVTSAGPDRLVLFQDHGLFPWLNVQQNVEFGLRVLGIPRKERRERAMEYLKLVHLQKFRHSYPFQLSGGMKQRTAIARALAVQPHMLLMDEPFGALDPRTRDILHLELQSLWMQTKKTIIFVTHSVEEAVRLADRIVIMASQPGRIRKVLKVPVGHPRDFLDPNLAELRTTILAELEDELNKLVKREGDEDWHLDDASISARGRKTPEVADGEGI
ncbi:MAG TPA: ABC transporter ATP-binding protein [Planctomycetota bacterium]|nr:ABC transporter ATP-binding protein [Planctomycetota bacterium]